MEAKCKNKLLLSELRPWLAEFKKLGQRGLRTLNLIKTYKSGENAAFWNAYVNNTMTTADRKAYEAHKSGTMVLQPFYETAMDDMATGFYKTLTGKAPAFYKGAGTYPTLSTTQSKLMFDNDSTTYYHSGVSQSTADWVGADLGVVRPVREIQILQGRNSTDDVDYYDNTILEYSADGNTWHALTGELQKQYVISWKGTPVDARYVRIRKLPSEKKSWISVREFIINPTTPESLGFSVETSNMDNAMAAFDQNPCTFYTNNGHIIFGKANGATTCTLLLDIRQAQNATLTQYDKKGKIISSTTVDNAFFTVKLSENTVKIVLTGCVNIYEIIQQ